jgi:outer membrane lipoprotein-sorting protein
MNRLITIFILSVLLMTFSFCSEAQTPEEKGLAVAIEADRRDQGFGNYTADLLMALKNRHGEESSRYIEYCVLEVEDDGDKILIVFDRPPDVKGTAVLNYSHKIGDDEQWIYLPALKRVKRISVANKSGSFVGSEFAYEDIVSQEVEKYTYHWLRDEVYDGQLCFIIERYPVYANSGYKRQVVWIDQSEYRTLKVDYYDRKNELLKTLTFKGYKQYLDKYWRSDEMIMINHQTGKSTILIWNNYQFGAGLKDSDFNRNSLKRAR